MLQCGKVGAAVWCNVCSGCALFVCVLQYVLQCCQCVVSVLQCGKVSVAVWCSVCSVCVLFEYVLHCGAVCVRCVALWCSECCSVVQCVLSVCSLRVRVTVWRSVYAAW